MHPAADIEVERLMVRELTLWQFAIWASRHADCRSIRDAGLMAMAALRPPAPAKEGR